MTAGALFGIGEMSRERFIEIYIDLGEREGVLLDPRADEERFMVIDQGQEHDLGPLYERFLALPARSRRYFLLRALRGAPITAEIDVPTYEDLQRRLLPRLRSGAFLDLARLDDLNRGRAPRGRHVHLAGEIYVAVVIDGERSMMAVTAPMLDDWGISFEQVRTDALENLARIDDEPLGMLSPGLWMGPWDDGYAASRILLTERLRVCEAPIVAAPNRETLLVADRHDGSALSAMVSLIESVTESGHALSRTLFRLDGDVLHPWTLPTTHPAARHHRRLCALERVRRYGEQQWLLQEASGEDVYVASAELDETKDGDVISRALWTEGVQALLPEVDRVHLLSASDDGTSSRLLVAALADLADLVGVVERTDELLPRYRTLRFPTDEELAEVAIPVVGDPTTASVSDPGMRS